MATHDYVIDNSTGANVRSDINNVLQAILTNNSSSSAPSTTAAYMWWADTTTGILKIRNSANDGWVELLQLDGTLTLENGSASTPALAFRDDLDTGIFSSSDNIFDIATGGVARLQLDSSETTFNEDGVDTDFRIESDTQTHMFFLDAGNNRIGINKSNPSHTVHIVPVATSTDGTDSVTNSTVAINALFVRNKGNSAGLSGQTYSNQIISSNGSNVALEIYTQGSATGCPIVFGINALEKARLDASGNFCIGTTTANEKLTIGDGDLSFFNSDSANNHRTTFIEFQNNSNRITSESNFGPDGSSAYTAGYKFTTKNFTGSAFETLTPFVIQANGHVGIGSTAPELALHVFDGGLSGRSTANSNCDMVIEGTTNTGIQFFAASQVQLRFGDASSTAAAAIIYEHANKLLKFNFETDGEIRYTAGSGYVLFRLYDDASASVTGINQMFELFDRSNAYEAIVLHHTGDHGNGTTVISPHTIPGSGGASQFIRLKSIAQGSGSTSMNLVVDGSVSKGSGSFLIDHPLPSLADTKTLRHSFVEAPQCDNIYRGKINLSSGTATVNLDTVSNMTEGTFVALNRDVQCFTSNETGWKAVKGVVSGNILTITSEDNSSTDTISWLVIGERQDPNIKGSTITDDDGYLLVEEDKRS